MITRRTTLESVALAGQKLLLITLVVCVCRPHEAFAQASGRATGFRHSVSGDDGKRSARLTGDSATFEGNSANIEGVQITTFKHDPDEREYLIIEAPTCRFEDPMVLSDDKISMRSGDGRLMVEGRGFTWSSETRLLLITSEVHATIVDVRESPNEETRKIEVHSDKLQYDLDADTITFIDAVRVLDRPVFEMRADEIEAVIPEGEEEPNRITATGHVVIVGYIQGREINVTGEKAVYEKDSAGGKVARLSNGVNWKSGLSSGRSDNLEMNLDERSFFGSGNVDLSLLQKVGDVPVNVTAASYEMSENEVSLVGDVVAIRGEESRMNCANMQISLDKEGEPTTIIARENVVFWILQESRETEAFGELMTYENIGQPNARVEITGMPSWRSNDDSGSGDMIEIFPVEERYLARGNAQAHIAARDTKEGDAPGGVMELGNEPIEVTTDQYEINAVGALFSGDVFVRHPQWTLQSGTVVFRFFENTKQVESMDAEDGVEFDTIPKEKPADKVSKDEPLVFSGNNPSSLTCQRLNVRFDEDTRKAAHMVAEQDVNMIQEGMHASGEKLDYDPVEDVFTLSGDAGVATADGKSVDGGPGTLFFVERASGQFSVRGRYRIVLPKDTLGEFDPSQLGNPGKGL